MRRFLSALSATALAASVAVTGAFPAGAAPMFVPKAPTAEHSDVIKVQDGPYWKRRRWSGPTNNPQVNRNLRKAWRNNGNWDGDWDGPKYGWYNGHKGYPYKRSGYRYYNGYWFPAAAFIAGAIVGGAIANSNTYYGGGGSAHVAWCYDHYRSYREYDNTFKPYYGPRRECISPYI